jgi:pimeloyl-ACP methyl ester carboxylesterase
VINTALFIGCQGTQLPAILTRPAKPCSAAVILLHPADDPSGRQFLFEHLAGILPEIGIAVLRYDRRACAGNRDVPYLVQVDDLSRARDALAKEVGTVPIGVWGFSQGAWVALLAAAADPAVAFLVLVGCSAVSPARQMRYGTAEQLRRAGFGPEAIAELGVLRSAYEDYERGHRSREQAQSVVDTFADRPWFYLSWVPPMLPKTPDWDDMDFDPVSAIRRIRCPVLAFYGDDEWVPVDESIDVWQNFFPDAAQMVIHRLPGTTHHPTLNGRRDISAISPDYTATLTSWLRDVVITLGGPQDQPVTGS